MIARGEVLERMTLVRSGALELEGLFQGGASSVPGAEPVVFAGPHPRLGGNMDSAVLAELVWTLARAGHPTLRFNWRGVGASQGVCRVPALPGDEAPSLEDEVDDLRAAIEQQVSQLGARTCALVGYSFGAVVAAQVAADHPAVARAVLVAPPVAHLRVPPLPPDGQGLATWIVTGELDPHAPPAGVQAAFAGRPPHVVAGANHSFLRGLPQLADFVRDALGGASHE